MAKITRYDGNLQAFAVNASDQKRTVFNQTTNSDDLTANINTDFLLGWEAVGNNVKPTVQDFSGAMFTNTQLSAYVHQTGVPEYDDEQEYYIGSITNSAGQLYRSLEDNNIGNPVTDKTKWTLITGDVGDKPYTVFTDLGADPTGVSDCAAAFNSFLADTSLPVLIVPVGNFNFTTQPNAVTRPCTIVGESETGSVFLQSYIPAGQSNGLISIIASTGKVKMSTMTIHVANNMTSPRTIEVESLPSDATSDVEIDRVRVNKLGAGSIGHCIAVDGSANSTLISNVNITNCTLVSDTDSALSLEKVEKVEISGDFESGAFAGIKIDGDAITDNEFININATKLNSLSIRQCTSVTVRSPLITTITTDATANKVQVFGEVTTLAGDWTDSIIFGAGTFESIKASPGLIKFPGSLIFQWVNIDLAPIDATQTAGEEDLAESFPTGILSFGGTSLIAGSNTNTPLISSVSNSRIRASQQGQETFTISVLVVGH